MRSLLVFLNALLICMFLSPVSVSAEMIQGRVVAIDLEKGEMHIELDTPADVTGESLLTVHFSQEQMERWSQQMRPDAVVRLRGEALDAQGHIRLQHIAPRMGLGPQREDRTGVRSRLGESRQGHGAGAGLGSQRGRRP
ncbi:hypothetical protein LGV61_12265 [Desulfurispirillum indicum]|uniref:hypothetical protein n=1 Tax=Desulfurispirillum indicum TaxID=936456 RepID=UPI001CFB0F27|nr:hypothetical protein [Desulfurispirillum indicum]UCZ56487.1 hypothetical protein LGV61_12265 [Desulfurispirillum indicum]